MKDKGVIMPGEMIHGVSVAELMTFVRRVARLLARRLPMEIRVDDLIGAGHIGLLEARDRFDPSLGVRFKDFAEFRIHGAMLDMLRTLDHLSRDKRTASKRVQQMKHALVCKLGRLPSDEELALALGYSLANLETERKYASVAKDPVSLDALLEDEAEPFRKEDVEDAAVRRLDSRRILARIEACLDERHFLVLRLYHHQDMTLREIGVLLDVTESRVCQILKEAREALSARFQSSAL